MTSLIAWALLLVIVVKHLGFMHRWHAGERRSSKGSTAWRVRPLPMIGSLQSRWSSSESASRSDWLVGSPNGLREDGMSVLVAGGVDREEVMRN